MAWLLLILKLVAFWASDIVTSLAPPDNSYRILMLMPLSSPSHRIFLIPLIEALADRGHKVEILSTLRPFPTTRNILQHRMEILPEDVEFEDVEFEDVEPEINIFGLHNYLSQMDSILSLPVSVSGELYTIPIVKELYKRRKEFDLFIMDDSFSEMVLPFVYGMPFITVATSGIDPIDSAMLGNPLNPSYVTYPIQVIELPLTFGERLRSLFNHIIISWLVKQNNMTLSVKKEIKKMFPNLPPLDEIKKNQSLTLINTHFSIEMALPLLPSQIEVAAMHCRPSQSLPMEIDDWLEGAGDAGVIYFSIGSTTIPPLYEKVFVKAFAKLKERLIWKYKRDIPEISSNTMLKRQLPQQDILGDSRVKLFISHGGLMDTQEAIYHGKPVLLLPILVDPGRDVHNIVRQGIGLSLELGHWNSSQIIKTIKELLSNPKYKRNAEVLSEALRDQPLSPTEKATFWTEYVIRHRGAPKLRCPAINQTWVDFLMLDIIAVGVALFVSIFCRR